MRPAQSPSQTPALLPPASTPLQVPKLEREAFGAGCWQLTTPAVEAGGTRGPNHGGQAPWDGSVCHSPTLAREYSRCCLLWKSVPDSNGAILPTKVKPNPQPQTSFWQHDLSISCWPYYPWLSGSVRPSLPSLSPLLWGITLRISLHQTPNQHHLEEACPDFHLPKDPCMAFSICFPQFLFCVSHRLGSSGDGINSGSFCPAQCLAQTHLVS